MHGAEGYFWNWCVRKDGFETISTAHTNAAAFAREWTAVLKAGPSTPCPQGTR